MTVRQFAMINYSPAKTLPWMTFEKILPNDHVRKRVRFPENGINTSAIYTMLIDILFLYTTSLSIR
jgi:hypothetical protein